MKKHFIVTCLILSIILTTQAQSNFSPGFVITNSNDTVQGWIDYRTNNINGKVCKFKPDVSAQVQVYEPGQIVGFRFTNAGKFYVSKTVPIDNVPTAVFLEYLVKGNMNLYFYQATEDLSSYYFFEKENGEMIPISKKEDEMIKQDDGATVRKVDNKYKGMINYLFRDYERLKSKAFDTKYQNKDMISLVKEYHDLTCTSGESCVIFETTPDKHLLKTVYSVYAGVDYTTYPLKYHIGKDAIPDKGFSPVIGGQLNVSVPRLLKSMSLQVDLSLSQRLQNKADDYSNDQQDLFMRYRLDNPDGYQYLYQEFQYGNKISYLKYSANVLLFSGNIGLKYTYPKNKLRPTLEAGASAYFILHQKESITIKQQMNNQEIKEIHMRLPLDKSVYPGYYAGLGADYILNEKHSVFVRVNWEYRQRMEYQEAWRVKLGYSF